MEHKLKYHFSKYHFLAVLFIVLFAWTIPGQARTFDTAISVPELGTFKGSLSDAGLYSIKYDPVNRGLIFNHSASNVPVKIQWTNGGSQILIAVTLINKYSGIPLTKINNSYYTGKLLYEDGEVGTFKMYISGKNLVFEFPKFSQVCLGCSTSTYTQTWSEQTNTTNSTILQTINGSATSSVISIVDSKLNQSGIYGSVNKSGLIGWWKLDNNYLDSSGNGYDGSITGTSLFKKIKHNNGTVLDGGTNYISTLATTTSSGTSVGWVTFTSLTQFDRVFSDTGGYIMLQMNNTLGDIKCTGYDTSEKNTDVYRVNLNTPYHVACAWNTTSLQLYINGIGIGSPIPFSGLGAVSLFKIGGVGSTTSLNGGVDSILLYNYRLNKQQLRQDYLVGIRELTAKYGNNATWSNQINGSGNASLPSNELNTLIQYFIPENHTSIDEVVCYTCNLEMIFTPTLTVSNMIQDTIYISETHATGYQQINYSFTPSMIYNYSLLTINLTNYNDTFRGTPVLENNTNRTLTGDYPNYVINFTAPVKDTISYHNISIPYNNPPSASGNNQNYEETHIMSIIFSSSDPDSNVLNNSLNINSTIKYGNSPINFNGLAIGNHVAYLNVTDFNGSLGGVYTWSNSTFWVNVSADVTPPATPVISSPANTTTTISLLMSNSSDSVLFGWRMAINGTGNYTALANTSINSTTATGLISGQIYDFYGLAYDSSGNPSLNSNMITVQTLTTDPTDALIIQKLNEIQAKQLLQDNLINDAGVLGFMGGLMGGIIAFVLIRRKRNN